jgi:hypothetical protein
MLSVSSWRTSRPRVAPSASRTVISLRRPDAFANSKFATFAHAINNTHDTAPNSSHKSGRVSPVICSCIATIVTPQFFFHTGYKDASRVRIELSSACAAAMFVPGFNRAITCSQCPPRIS